MNAVTLAACVTVPPTCVRSESEGPFTMLMSGLPTHIFTMYNSCGNPSWTSSLMIVNPASLKISCHFKFDLPDEPVSELVHKPGVMPTVKPT